MMRIPALIVLLLSSVPVASAQKLDVKIVGREDNETEYTYVVPGHFTAQSNSSANCYGSESALGNSSNVNCTGSTITTGATTPAQQISYHVRGATFTLLLPDGRAVVVNCESKFAEHMAGPAGNHRSCRVPLVDNIQADFKGDKAKLMWVVSLDGKKIQSETYKVLAVLGKGDQKNER
jgi:hypothetical protein